MAIFMGKFDVSSVCNILKFTEDSRIYFKGKDYRYVIINDDFLTTDLIESNSVNLIVTSSPYNVDIQYESFRDNIPYDKYLEFTEKWLRKALNLVKMMGGYV